MLKLSIAALLFSFTFSSAAFARSGLHTATGWKFPNSPAEGSAPVGVTVSLPTGMAGHSDLVPYILHSPDQEEAGSCLYMSLTGIAEHFLARRDPSASRAPEGELDLSERWLMNIAGLEEDENGMENWKTDSIYLFNNHGQESVLNRDYPFAKGWYRRDEEGNLVRSRRGAKGAEYDASYSWIDERKKAEGAPRVKLPRFSRTVLFADPEDNQWNTGVMPAGIVHEIKRALREGKPVHVIYNHFGYWHANIILGYDDSFDNQDCKFVRDFVAYMKKEVQALREKAAGEKDADERKRLLDRAEKFTDAYRGTEESWAKLGGCEKRGAFYVRDSIYRDSAAPLYGYATKDSSDDANYAKKIVMLEYDFVRTMANHAVVIDGAWPQM